MFLFLSYLHCPDFHGKSRILVELFTAYYVSSLLVVVQSNFVFIFSSWAVCVPDILIGDLSILSLFGTCHLCICPN